MADNRKQLKTDYEIVFGSAEGKRVLNDIIRNTHILEPVFDVDPNRTSFNEGARNEGLRILTILNYKPVDLIQTVKDIQHG